MAEYIDKEKLPKRKEYWDDDFGAGYDTCLDDVDKIPVEDVQPVRHGRWMAHHFGPDYQNDVDVPYDDNDLMQWGCFCSECGLDSLLNGNEKDVPSPYCPNCGAQMDGGDT